MITLHRSRDGPGRLGRLRTVTRHERTERVDDVQREALDVFRPEIVEDQAMGERNQGRLDRV